MTTKIQKFLMRLSRKEKDFVSDLIEKVISGETVGFEIKKLEGYEFTFRLKKGPFRIIYIKKGRDVDICSVTRRSEKTYRDY